MSRAPEGSEQNAAPAPAPLGTQTGELSHDEEELGVVAGANQPAAGTLDFSAEGGQAGLEQAGLLVEDDQLETAGEGRMSKAVFLSELRASVEAALAPAGQGVAESVAAQLNEAMRFYESRTAAELEADIRREVPEAVGAKTAGAYVDAIASRVRRGVASGALTERSDAGPGRGGGAGQPVEGATAQAGSPLMQLGKAGEPPLAGLRLLAKGRGGRLIEAVAEDPLALRAELGAGEPLEGRVRGALEAAFGRDFGGVRVHTGAAAAESAAELDARAFTVGQDIAFGAGEYRPGTVVGDALIAHELAHVVQQGSAAAAEMGSGGALHENAFEESAALESDADEAAVGAMASLYLGGRGPLEQLARNAAPRFRSGLGLRRCGTTATAVEFPTYSQIIADSTITGAAATAWAGTVADCTESPNQRREQAFWIQWRPSSGAYSAGSTVYGPWVGPGEGAYVDPGAKPPDTGSDADAVCTVGMYHSHTPTTYREVGRGIGPSGADNTFHDHHQVAGVVNDFVDAGGGNIPAHHPKDAAATLYHSGPERRPSS